MPNTLTTAQLEAAKTMITNGNVIGFYNYMASQGYGYANLGIGVVECTLLSGGSTAQNYMVQEADRRGITITASKVADIESTMANGYINTLISNSERQGNGGSTSIDITYKEALKFHTDGFENKLGLPKELWTLYKPSEILPDAKLESNWSKTIDPTQTGGLNPALNFSSGFGLDMGLAAQHALANGDFSTFAKAGEWSTGVSIAQVKATGIAMGMSDASAGCNAAISSGIQQAQAGATANLAQNPVTAPADLGTPARNSASLVNTNGAHSMTVLSGGTVSDLWQVQKNAGSTFTLDEFSKAVLASNPDITNINAVQADQTIYVPEKLSDGSITLHYAAGASVNNNAITGEYHMVVPNASGAGVTVYERKVDGDAGYLVKETSSDAAGNVTFASQGYQATLSSDTVVISGSAAALSNGDGTYTVESTDGRGNATTYSATKDSTGAVHLTAITEVNGAPPEANTAGVANAAFADAKFTPTDLFTRPGEVLPYVEAVDTTNTAGGTTPSPASLTPNGNWYDSPAVRQGATLGSDAVSLIAAIRGGKPLAIASSGFNLASHVLGDPNVASVVGALSAVTSIDSFVHAIEKGDLGRILIDGGGLARNAMTIYNNTFTQNMYAQFGGEAAFRTAVDEGNQLAVGLAQESVDNGARLVDLGNCIAYANIVNSVLHGDVKGAVISAVALVPVYGQVAAAVLTVLDAISMQFFAGNQSFEADGGFVFNANSPYTGSVGILPGNGHNGYGDTNGGANVPWNDLMDKLLTQTLKQVDASKGIFGVEMGIIPERMPRVSFKAGVMLLHLKDPSTGEESVRTFDLKGQYLTPGSVEDLYARAPWGPTANLNGFVGRGTSAADRVATQTQVRSSTDYVTVYEAARDAQNFYLNLAQQFTDAVYASGAIAPKWEVDTANAQRAAGNFSGVLSADYQKLDAHRNTPYYGSFRPLVLNLDNSAQVYYGGTLKEIGSTGITVTHHTQGTGVFFDYDDDGYAEETDWIGPRDGFLVLDRNGDGVINKGEDMLSDAPTDGAYGSTTQNPLQFLDANGDGVFNSLDPVFANLQVWQDINSNGVVDKSELHHLSDLGITQINFKADNSSYTNGTQSSIVLGGSFVMHGQTQQMAHAHLNAETYGVATAAVGGNSVMVLEEWVTNVPTPTQVTGPKTTPGQQYLMATKVFDFGAQAATATGHVHTSSDGVLKATDETLDGQEDTRIVVSVEQLLANDKSSAGKVNFAGLTGNAVGGVATYDANKNTVSFTPYANFNTKANGQISFGYTVTDAQGHSVQATAVVDVGAVDDAATLTATPGRRQATWGDVSVNRNASGAVYYEFPTIDTVSGQVPDTPPGSVTVLGYTGPEGAALKPSSDGVLGFAGGKMYFAWFGTKGNAATQSDWMEIWVNSELTGTVKVSDVDAAPGALALSVDDKRHGQFGNAMLTDNHDGTATYNYNRTSFLPRAPSYHYTGDGDGTTGYYYQSQAGFVGPQDAFYVKIHETVGGQPVDTYERVIVNAPTELSTENDSGRITQLVNGMPASSVITSGAPIILDLNDNGFLFTSAENSSAFYDLAGDGISRATAWTSGKDGILAFDANGDGKISGKAEISFKDYLPGATTDLEGLRAFDTNHDGTFSNADAQWQQFRVWQDKNEDGVQTADELFTLTERGIASINLTSDGVTSSAGGVTLHGIGSYTRIDGSTGKLADAELAYTNETAGSVSNDTVVLTATNTVANTGGGDDNITGSALADQINAGTGNDVVNAGGGDDVVFGGAGDDHLAGGDGNDVLWGGIGDDVLLGEAGDDKLHGGDGDDVLNGGDGNDELWGDRGNDTMTGGAGVDTYHFELGGGHDTINEVGNEVSHLVLGEGLSVQNSWVETFSDTLTGGTGYILHFSENDSLTLHGFSTGTGPASTSLTPTLVQLTFADGGKLNMAQMDTVRPAVYAPVPTPVPPGNHAPTVVTAIANQSVNEDSTFTFAVPAATFADADAGDKLTLSATLGDGSALPSWLTFNAATRTFLGTPLNDQVGTVALKVVATDAGGLSASSIFNVQVVNTNDAPVVATQLTTQAATSGTAFNYVVPMTGATATFKDVDVGDVLTLSATLVGGATLPSWLSFNAATGTFSGTPTLAVGAPATSLNVQVKATDLAGASVTSGFALAVVPATVSPGTGDPGEGAATTGDDVLTATTQPGRLNGGDGNDTLYGSWGNNVLIGGNGNDKLYGVGGPHNELYGGDGDDLLVAGWGSDDLYGGDGDDTLIANGGPANLLDGGDGNDNLTGGWGEDELRAGEGNNTVHANGSFSRISAGAGTDSLYGSWGNDQISAGAGNDVIDTGGGNNAVTAGAGSDLITGGAGADWVAGGTGNDTFTDGGGYDLLAFNRGDGADTWVHSAWGQNSISLGGGIKYADLKLAKSDNDLVVDMGQGDKITLKDWYADVAYQSVDKLQVITVGGDYNAASSDKTVNKKVEEFDFTQLVQKFDAVRATSPSGTNDGNAVANGWAVMNSLLDAHLQGSDTYALGGDLSFEYATHSGAGGGSLASIGLTAMKTNLTGGNEWRGLSSTAQLAQGTAGWA